MANLFVWTCRGTRFDRLSNLSSRAMAIKLTRNYSSNEILATASLSNGRDIIFSCGKLARMANGAAIAQSGDTAVMVTAVCKKGNSSNDSFMPLSVDFRMKSAAAGRIPTNYLRRELGPSERETLTSRLVDRCLRPLFPKNYFSEVQLMSNVLSVDGVHDPEVLCINAASMALSLSDIPWNGPVGAVRVGCIGGEIVFNPTRKELLESDMNMIVAGQSSSKVVMIEGSFNDLDLGTVMRGVGMGLKEIRKIVDVIQNLTVQHGKRKQSVAEEKSLQELLQHMESHYLKDIRQVLTDATLDKQSRDDAIASLREVVIADCLKDGVSNCEVSFRKAFDVFVRSVFRNLILETGKRCDGRGLLDLRNISCDVGLYNPLHGSAVFQRGQTQVLCTVALDSPQSAIKTDSYTILTSGPKEKSFFLTYEFPGYATNEIKQGRGINRREIGHGALAEKGLRPVVPSDFPFCIRLTSEVLESNGSSSMASVCGGSLALLDAGVPISAMAAGIAMGLVTRCNSEGEIEDYRILTDILGIEDYMGDMDLKMAGTKKGLTALQADFKIAGITIELLNAALLQGHTAKKNILKIMKKAISKPRLKKDNMPILETFEVPPHKRNKLVGPAWVNIKKVFLETGVQITHIEDSKFSAFAPNEAAMDEAYDLVQKLMDTAAEPEFEFGAIYSVKILELKEAGAMVSLHPQLMPIFIPTMHLDVRKAAHPSALGFSVGQKISVKYFGRDPANGQIRLSRRALQESTGRVKDLESAPSIQTQLSRERAVLTADDDSAETK